MYENTVVVWLGGNAVHWEHTREFNMKQDVSAARIVTGCSVPLILLPCMGVVSSFTTTGPELRHFLSGKNALCDYLVKTTVDEAEKYAKGMARDFEELTQWWGDKECFGFMPEQPAKRLILFAPNEGEWETISENWDNVVHLPSKAGDHLQDLDYQTILSCIAHTIA